MRWCKQYFTIFDDNVVIYLLNIFLETADMKKNLKLSCIMGRKCNAQKKATLFQLNQSSK